MISGWSVATFIDTVAYVSNRLTRELPGNPELVISRPILAEIHERVQRDIRRFRAFHHLQQLNESKCAGLACYWISKLKPVICTSGTGQHINEILGLFFAFSLYAAAGKPLRAKRNRMQDFTTETVYSLRYRDLSSSALILYLYAFEDN